MLDAIEYERIQWHTEDFPDEYSGKPTLEIESAWNRLFQRESPFFNCLNFVPERLIRQQFWFSAR